MGRILVTGASGNVGRYTAQYALENGQEVTAAGTHTDTLAEMFGDRVEIVYFDFTDPKTFPSALKDVDRVFIMRPPHLGNPEDLKPFIDALKERGSIRLVSFLSLIGVENNPFPPHHKIEKYIEQANLPYCHIRPGFFMQNISGVHAFEIRHFNRIVVPVKKAMHTCRFNIFRFFTVRITHAAGRGKTDLYVSFRIFPQHLHSRSMRLQDIVCHIKAVPYHSTYARCMDSSQIPMSYKALRLIEGEEIRNPV